MGKITAKRRKRMKSSTFALPKERKFPIPDAAHARNALSRVSQYGSPSEVKRVKAAVHKKFPSIKIS